MKIFSTILMLSFSCFAYASPISCDVSSSGDAHITMKVPHPEHALVHRPSGETVWLQTSSDFIHKQIDNFETLDAWTLTSKSQGTVWVNGEATIQPIFQGNGKYHLYIAENTETERENTVFIECCFYVEETEKKSRQGIKGESVCQLDL